MRSNIKAMLLAFCAVMIGIVSGCGGGGGSTGAGASTPSASAGSTTTGGTTTTPTATGAALYDASCAGCHGTITATNLTTPTDLTTIKNAIASNLGGMAMFSTVSDADLQAMADAVNNPTTPPPPPPVVTDGATLYAGNCAGCHGALATSSKTGMTLARLQSAISGNVGGMGPLSRLTAAQQQAIVTALNPTTPPPPPPVVTDGATLYAGNCAGCHGALATSSKIGMTLARLQTAISGNVGGMGPLSRLTAAQQQAIVTVLNPATPPPVVTDGATLYANNCASCHGPLASSTKAGATVARTQAAISGNIGGMGSLSNLSAAQLTAIASVLATVTTPPVTPACGSCHAIPPASGRHSKHRSVATCATCHGSGYSNTTVNAATHNNGIKNVGGSSGWNATTRSCSNSCHGSKSW